MYIVVNSSLNMQKGKIAAQVGHAVSKIIRYYEKKSQTAIYKNWLNNGEPTIVLKSTEDELKQLVDTYESHKKDLYCFTIHDAGKTQVEAGSLTVVGFSLYEDTMMPASIKNLKLL